MASAFERTDEHAFGTWNEDKAIIQIRDVPGGKTNVDPIKGYRKSPGKGFPIIDSFTVDVAKDIPEYKNYLEQIAAQLIKSVKIFHEQGLISDAEIDSLKRG
jgi:hypothetical protein